MTTQSICFAGLSRDEQGQVEGAFHKANAGSRWRLASESEAAVVVVDMDSMYGQMSLMKALSNGKVVVALTAGTCAWLKEQGVEVEFVRKVLEGRPHIVDAMKNGEVQLVINTTEGKQSLADSFEIRRTALMMKIPYYTTAAGAAAAAQAIATAGAEQLEVRPLQSYA